MSMGKVKVLVVGFDKDQQQAFWDVIPAEVDWQDSPNVREEQAKAQAGARFDGLRGDYAEVVDMLLVEDLVSMTSRIDRRPIEEVEADYAELEAGAADHVPEPDVDDGVYCCPNCEKPYTCQGQRDGLCARCEQEPEAREWWAKRQEERHA